MRKLIGFVFSFAAAAAAANAQSLSVGFIGGVPFSDAIKTTTIAGLSALPTSSNFVLGPSVQINLPKNFRIEADALYRPLGFSLGILTAAGHEFRFPLLLQYRFGKSAIRPYVEGGASFDHISGLKAIISGPGKLLDPSQASTVVGAGIDIKVPLIRRISAELRYTRLGKPTFQDISNLNNAEVLVGFHF